ncbi:ATP-binding protein [Streptomyces johnsoniae]|uniref:ATP-binding protein n=1 Tax=Streptomyces johnsoniae TaxID=3075532 RepID=A0ABU2SCV3_9ACTN|nr:ATP-binding protein [Streptomyces sp. DSM 41886]MDT0446811.1 ATP-binding protein [Streptomyces sp. DSM 41886]
MSVTGRMVDDLDVRAWALTASAHEVGRWRRVVGEVLVEWGATDPAVELAKLGVSELLTNVVTHVDSAFCCLVVARAEREAIVQVQDFSPTMPRIVEPDWTRESGRGLWLLRQLACRFGAQRTCIGKIIWFGCELARQEDAVR